MGAPSWTSWVGTLPWEQGPKEGDDLETQTARSLCPQRRLFPSRLTRLLTFHQKKTGSQNFHQKGGALKVEDGEGREGEGPEG